MSCSSGNILNKNILLIIGAGKHQISLIQTAVKMGFYTVAVDVNTNAEGFLYSDDKIVHSAYDYNGILNIIYDRLDISRIKGVITQAARGCILAVSKISEKLELRHLNSASAALVISKENTSRLLNDNYLIGIYSSLKEVPPDIEYPCVVKFDNLSGNVGVFRVKSKDELNELEAGRDKKKVIVEKFIKGRNFGVIGIKNGEDVKFYGIIEKYVNPNLTPDYSIFPAQISRLTKRILLDYSLYVLDKLGIDFGPFQLEVILDENGKPFFVELEPSVLGSYISEMMIPSVSLNNMVEDSITLVCSGKLKKKKYASKYVYLQKYHYANQCGQIKGWKFVNKKRNIVFKPYLDVGGHITDIKLYVANSFVIGKNIREVRKNIQDFELIIRVE